MKPNTLTIASLVSIVLLPFHIGGDVAFGFDKGGPGMVYVVVPVLLVVACGALLLAERRSGLVIMLLGGLAALGMPHHPPKQRVHSRGRELARRTLFHVDPHGARRYWRPRGDTLGARTVEAAFGGGLSLMRPLRYSINVTLDGCCDHSAIVPDEDLHCHAAENLDRAPKLVSRLEFASGAVAMRYDPRR